MSKLAKALETLRQKESKVLVKELTEAQTALQKARVDLAFGRLPNNAQIDQLRKQIARIKTVLKQKEATHA